MLSPRGRKVELCLRKGDKLLIQFGHNDDVERATEQLFARAND